MNNELMILPAREFGKIRLVRIPNDYQGQEVFRHVTRLIAEVEEASAGYVWEDIRTSLEDHGFEIVEFLLGPALD